MPIPSRGDLVNRPRSTALQILHQWAAAGKGVPAPHPEDEVFGWGYHEMEGLIFQLERATFERAEEPVNNKEDAKRISAKAKSYFDQGFN